MLPVPGTADTPKPAAPDDLGNLIASLGKPEPTQNTKAAAGAKVAPGTEAPAATPKSAAPANSQTVYYLQAGAFRSESDAEAVKARILLIGLSAQVQKAQVNGTTINRVRVGPFKGIDEMNRSRARLGEEKIASSVIRQ
jgi:cell division protein FtsN